MSNEQNQSDTSAHPVDTLVMPCPRFEFRWVKTGETWAQRECIYSLVFPLREHDIRKEDENGKIITLEHFAEIGRTKVNGGRGDAPIFNGNVDTPYRDGAHSKWDREALGVNFPIVAVCGDVWNIVA